MLFDHISCTGGRLRAPSPPRRPLARGLLLLALAAVLAAPRGTAAQVGLPPAQTPAEQSAPEAEPAAEEVKILIATLEEEQARARLVAQLRLMLAAQEAAEPSKPDAGGATAEALKQISGEMAQISNELVVAATGLEDLPDIGEWLRQQASSPERRALWAQVLGNLALTIGLGYAALWLARLALLRPRRRLADRSPERPWVRLPLLALAAVLDLAPIAAFAATAFLTLGALSPLPTTRLVALAWFHAIILVHLAQVLARAVFAAGTPTLRLSQLSDVAARQGESWVRRFALVGVYGYFGIQAGGFLELPAAGFDALMRLLGLVLTFMLAALILRLRTPVARWIRGIEGKTMWRLRGRLAAVWHILALLYVALLYGIWALQVNDGATTMLRGTALSVVTLILAAWAVTSVGDSGRPCVSPQPVPRTIPQKLRRRLIRYVPALRAAARWLIQITAVLAFLQAWGVPSFAWFAQDPGRVLALTATSLVLTLLVALFVWEGSSLAISAYLAEHDNRAGLPPLHSARTRTLLSVARTALTVVLSVVTILIVLSEIGVNIAPLLAAAGVLGLAVGFGSQQLVKDLITGFFILLEDVFSVGDVIKVGERAGLVEEVSIRTVRLRDLAGTVHTIPFSTIDSVSNLTKEFAFHVFDIGVAYREDVDQVMDTLREIGAEMRADPNFGDLILDDLEVFGLDAFADSALVIKGRIKTRPIKQWEVGREFNRHVKARFAELDIEIPFPHRTLYFGVDKDRTATQIRVQTESAPRPAAEDEDSVRDLVDRVHDAIVPET